MTRLKIGVLFLITLLTPNISGSNAFIEYRPVIKDGIQKKKKIVISEEDLDCLILNTYHEARGESKTGQIAVMQVVLNRVENKKFPSSICAVIKQGPTYTNKKGNVLPIIGKCQFNWYCDGKTDNTIDRKTYEKMYKLAYEVLNNRLDITDDSLYYHSRNLNSNWSKRLIKTATIDNHIFYKDKG